MEGRLSLHCTERQSVVVFSFMAEIKERLQSKNPDAIVDVQPHDRFSVSIMMRWRIAEQGYGVHRLVSTHEIMSAKWGPADLVSHMVEEICHSREEAIHA